MEAGERFSPADGGQKSIFLTMRRARTPSTVNFDVESATRTEEAIVWTPTASIN